MRNSTIKFVKAFAKVQDGAAAVEYALLAALVAGIIITAVTPLGNAITTAFGNIATTLTNASTPADQGQ